MRMTVEVAREKKARLEKDIRDLLGKFSKETGLLAKINEEPVFEWGNPETPVGYLVSVEVKV